MSIEKIVTQAWQRQAVWLWLLLPLSVLYGLLTMLRHHAYKTGLLPSYRAPVPVMIIGNITVGGSGKTPLIIALLQHLQQQGIAVGVISRGYGGDSRQMPTLVHNHSLPASVGDEPCLIVDSTGAPMAVSPNRQHAITTLLEAYPNLQLIIADDGLQHYALQRDIEWIVVDADRGFGNQQLLPTGFLREPLTRLKNATIIFHEKPHSLSPYEPILESYLKSAPPLTMQLQPDHLEHLWQPISAPAQQTCRLPITGDSVHAVSGIGYPQRFFDTLTELGFIVIPHPYPDHYAFTIEDLLLYQEHPIIVTSKDAVKIRALLEQAGAEAALHSDYIELINRLWVLPVTAVLSESCFEDLRQQLKRLNIISKSVLNKVSLS